MQFVQIAATSKKACTRNPINSGVKEGRTMKQIRYISLLLILILLATGCAGNYGIFKRKTGSESKATKQQLIDNWSDFDILLVYHTGYKPPRLIAIIFNAKNDNMNLSVKSSSRIVKVKDQEMWMQVVKEHTTSDGEFVLIWGPRQDSANTGVQEIWGPDNQLYGYTIYQENAVVLDRVELVDEKTLRLSGHSPRLVGGPAK